MSSKDLLKDNKILLAHGSGGLLTHNLIKDLFAAEFANDALDPLADAAVLKLSSREIAFTTDSYVVSPLFFPGGDIGKLAVCGTVNDLAVMGSEPLYISCAFIIEEGLGLDTLTAVVRSMKKAAAEAGVKIVTGDTKVVGKGSCDKLFINTSGIGRRMSALTLGVENIKPGDKIIVSGTLGDHGITILTQRKGLKFSHAIKSDCAPLWGMIRSVLDTGARVRFMRDATRGGLSAVLNEVADGRGFGIDIEERSIPILGQVRSAADLLGLDPLYIANEGKIVLIVDDNDAAKALKAIRRDPLGREAKIIGLVVAGHKGQVCLKTASGGLRIIDMPVAEQLPRIC